MLSVLKKTEKLRQSIGGEKDTSLEPPKNLPDLARDLYERDVQKNSNSNSFASSVNVDSNNSSTQVIASNFSKPVHEPSKDSVPGLDLSLVRQHLAASQSAIQSMPLQSSQSTQSNISIQQPASQPIQSNISQSITPSLEQNISQQFVHPQQNYQPIYSQVQQPIQQYSQQQSIQSQPLTQQPSSYSLPQDSINAMGVMTDDAGFFKEFEEHVRNNGLNTDIVGELLDKNLLDNMMLYHTTKGDDTPFYASSAELSHAIKVKLEDLQNFERTWISNKQKMDLMKKFSSTIESDIHLRSEELKKLLTESRRRGNSNGFSNNLSSNSSIPNTVVPSSNSNNSISNINSSSTSDSVSNFNNTSVNVSPRVTTITPTIISPIIGSSVYHPSSISVDSSSISSSNIAPSVSQSIPPSNSQSIPQSVQQQSSFQHIQQQPISQQPISSSKYMLSKYITNDSSKFFYTVDGKVFKSLYDLINGLEVMSGDSFNHHVNNSRNDFSNWIKGVFLDFELSNSINLFFNREGLLNFLKNNTY